MNRLSLTDGCQTRQAELVPSVKRTGVPRNPAAAGFGQADRPVQVAFGHHREAGTPEQEAAPEGERVMESIARMIDLRPRAYPVAPEPLGDFLACAQECALICRLCAQACLEEVEDRGAHLLGCVEVTEDCARACEAAVLAAARWSQPRDPRLDNALTLVDVCTLACAACAEHCEVPPYEHCRLCAEACRRCERAGLLLTAGLGW